MTDELNQPDLAPAATLPSLVLNAVHSGAATADPGALLVSCNITDADGQTFDEVHVYRESDPFSSLAPVIKEWLVANPDFPVTPYEPPTDEEKRRSMQPLTARQFRLGLVNSGISPSAVTNTIAAMPAGADRDNAQIEWEFATTFNRMHPLIATVGAALGLSDAQIDAMWLAAVSL